MRVLVYSILVGIIGCIYMHQPTYAQKRFTDPDPIHTKNLDDVSNLEDDTLRQGARDLTENLNGINTAEVEDTSSAWEKVTNGIKTVVNYALSIIGLVAVVYLLYHGFMVLTAGSNDDKVSKGMKGVQYALIAIVGIGLTWLFLSLVFRVIGEVT